MIDTNSSLFFYNRVEKVKEGPIEVDKTFRDFVNLGAGNVLRGIQIADNLLVVVLNDGREEKFEQQVAVRGKAEVQTVRKFVQTQIPIETIEQVQAFYQKYDK